MSIYINGVEIKNQIVIITNTDSPYTVPGNIDNLSVLCNCASGAITTNIPTAVGISGRIYCIKKIDSTGNAVTIDGNGTETIDGQLNKILNLYNTSITIQSDGSNWCIL